MKASEMRQETESILSESHLARSESEIVNTAEAEPVNFGDVHGDPAALISLCENMRKRRHRTYRYSVALTFVLILLAGLLNVYLSQSGRSNFETLKYVVILTSAISICPMIFFPFTLLLKPSRKQGEALKRLAATSDVRAIGALWEGGYDDKVLRKAITSALVRLLPQVEHRHTHLFTGRQVLGFSTLVHNAVNPKLEKYYDEALVLACIQAASEVGGEQAVAHFQEVVDTPGDSDRLQRIKSEVAKYLPALRARWEKESRGEKLLRSASFGETSSLLRPSLNHDSSDSEKLLRPY